MLNYIFAWLLDIERERSGGSYFNASNFIIDLIVLLSPSKMRAGFVVGIILGCLDHPILVIILFCS